MRSFAWIALVVACGHLALGAGLAHAHQSSVTYVEADLAGAEVHVKVRLAPRDIAEDLGASDAPLEPAALLAAERDHILEHVTARVEVQDGDTPCPPAAAAAAVEGDR